MVTCGKCQLQNSLDSSFCRKCGTELDADALQQAKSELGRTVAQGFVLFNEGKIEEAGLIAELALADDPTLTTAISLKGMCHERKGELAEALAAYEKVLEYAPDSALDRIKVSQLRAAISARASIVQEERAAPDRKMAFAVAVLAVVFFCGVGALASKLLSESQTKAPLASTQQPQSSVGEGFVDAPTGSNPIPSPATANGQAPVVDNRRPVESTVAPGDTGNIPAPNSNRSTSSNDSGTGLSPVTPFGDGRTLPPVGIGETTITPISSQTGPPASAPAKSQDPDPDENKGSQTAQKPPQDPVDDPGEISISVSNRTPKNSGGSQAVDDGSAAQNLGKVASQEFQLKKYDSAAKKYEKLLHSGGDPANVNQRLAQCYENLGKKGDALGAYQKAARALKDNIQAGRGNAARQKAALESCEAAIKVLNEGV